MSNPLTLLSNELNQLLSLDGDVNLEVEVELTNRCPCPCIITRWGKEGRNSPFIIISFVIYYRSKANSGSQERHMDKYVPLLW